MVKGGKFRRDIGIGSRAWAEGRLKELEGQGFEGFTRPVGYGEGQWGLPRINSHGNLNWLVEYRVPKKR